MKCQVCKHVIQGTALIVAFAHWTEDSPPAVTICSHCAHSIVGPAAYKRLQVAWSDSPYAQLELPVAPQ